MGVTNESTELAMDELKKIMFAQPTLREAANHIGIDESTISNYLSKKMQIKSWDEYKEKMFFPTKARLINLLLVKSATDTRALVFALQWLCGMRPKYEVSETIQQGGAQIQLKYSLDVPEQVRDVYSV